MPVSSERESWVLCCKLPELLSRVNHRGAGIRRSLVRLSAGPRCPVVRQSELRDVVCKQPQQCPRLSSELRSSLSTHIHPRVRCVIVWDGKCIHAGGSVLVALGTQRVQSVAVHIGIMSRARSNREHALRQPFPRQEAGMDTASPSMAKELPTILSCW